MSRQLPSFDLVVATVGRTDELGRLLDSIAAQRYERARVIVVDQNEDERVTQTLVGRAGELVHLRASRGLSRARNAGLQAVGADVIAFPDDDCVYPSGLLDRLAARFLDNPALDGIAGRAQDASGSSSASWQTDAAILTAENLWNRANAATIFLRRDLVARVGNFDEHLGLGSGEPWSSGEEIDYLIRAVRRGARIEYDPSLVVRHDVREDTARVGERDGASVGYLLRKHEYPARTVARMLVRPLAGVLVSILGRDRAEARYRLATFRGRMRGYRGATRAKSSA